MSNMATWHARPQTADNELDQIWATLEEAVRTDPSIEEVTGLPSKVIEDHVVAAVKMHFTRLQEEDKGVTALLDPDSWIHLYMMGLVVGITFGRKQR